MSNTDQAWKVPSTPGESCSSFIKATQCTSTYNSTPRSFQRIRLIRFLPLPAQSTEPVRISTSCRVNYTSDIHTGKPTCPRVSGIGRCRGTACGHCSIWLAGVGSSVDFVDAGGSVIRTPSPQNIVALTVGNPHGADACLAAPSEQSGTGCLPTGRRNSPDGRLVACLPKVGGQRAEAVFAAISGDARRSRVSPDL